MRAFLSSLLLFFLAYPGGAVADSDVKELEARLEAAADNEVKTHIFGQKDWRKLAERLSSVEPEGFEVCQDHDFKAMAGRYAVSFSEDGSICRIYDLSFPTLNILFKGQAVAKLPVQSFKARDYIHWMNGDYEKVLGQIETFKTDFSTDKNIKLSRWVKTIKFKPSSLHSFQNAPVVKETGLPVSFRASDLDLGKNFAFTERDKKNLRGLVKTIQSQNGGTHNLMSMQNQMAWEELIEKPETLLAKIKFDWNQLDKVYEIFLEGEFLPINGPIALVDHGASYKLATERVLRSVVRSALNQVVGFVPGQAKTILSLALNEIFDHMETAYEYQLNQLEGTLRAASRGDLQTDLDRQSISTSMNILFAARADIFTEFLMSTAQGRNFDWDDFEDVGRRARHTYEKLRDITLTNNNSRMVLKKNCKMELIDDYFGVCSKGEKKATHSMISENTILFWNLGAPLVYNHNMDSQVLLMRSASYLLSIGARSFDLPIASFLTTYLADALKTYAFAGITDEAFLRNAIYLEGLKYGSLDSEQARMLKWMYLQNINPFLVKSRSMENSVIRKQAANLGLEVSELPLQIDLN